jgi:hypothetical protein
VTRVAALVGVVALAVSPAAAAHGDGGARGYRSNVTSVKPATPGIEVVVLEGDDRLALTNRTGRTIVVHGYRGEPYLRLTGEAVFRNRRSPATYLNEERFGEVDVPEGADPKAPPDWEQVADEPYYEWHDHRIHWMSPVDPPQIRRAPDRPHHVLDWSVPLAVGDEKVTLGGSLDYEPLDEGAFKPILIAPLAAFVLAGGAFWWFRRRRVSRSGA